VGRGRQRGGGPRSARRGPAGPRLFVALDPPAAVRHRLAGWLREQRAALPGVRPVAEEHLHVTLAFLGERPPSEVEPVAAAVAAAASTGAAADLGVGAPLWLPPRRPRVLTVEVHDDRGDLRALQADVASALEAAVGWREDRAFRPHLTLGRLRPDALRERPAPAATPALRFDGEAVTLYRSLLEPTGARYVAVERVPLG
jgi:2'-5' RNA ligase